MINGIVSRETLKSEAFKLNIELDNEAMEKFDLFAGLLLLWNEKINLTRITDPEEITVKHFTDSLTLLWALEDIPVGATLIDIGTGAGFPSVPVSIVRPDLRITAVDSVNKKLHFVRTAASELSLNISVVHARAEELGRQKRYRESFDIAAARAVANLRDLSEYCIPLVKKGGLFAALKGPLAGEEISKSENAVKKLGGEILQIKNTVLADKSERNIVIIKKISQTSTQYPRQSAQIKKNPLL